MIFRCLRPPKGITRRITPQKSACDKVSSGVGIVPFGSPRSRNQVSFGENCAPWKGGGPQRETDPPGNWFAPPGSNRSNGRGNEAVGAFGVEGRDGDLASVQAIT